MAGKLSMSSESGSPSPVPVVLQVEERSRGFECDFVAEKPLDILQSECPVCLQVLCEPYQVSCCGKRFCRTCIEPIKDNKKLCPTCNKENFDAFHDKGLQQSLYGFLVFFSHQKEGCEWTGELGHLEEHLNLNPQPDKQFEGCLFTEIKCLFCSHSHQRGKIQTHQSDLCPKRPFSCQYCQYNSGYEDIVNNHLPVCGSHPVQCPNMCGAFPQRQDLEEHASNVCPLTIINCDYHCVGCEVRLPRKAMSDHLNENTVTHVHQLLGNVKTRNQTFCKEQDESQEKIAGLRNAQDQSRREISELKKDMQEKIAGLRNAQDQSHREISELKKDMQEKNAGLRNELKKDTQKHTRIASETRRLLLWIILPAVVALIGIPIEKANRLEQKLQDQEGLLGLIMKVNMLEQELQQKEELFGGLTKKVSRLEQELHQKEEVFEGLTEKVSRLEQEVQQKEELFRGLTKKVSRLEQEVQQKEELFRGLTKKVSRLEQEVQQKEEIFGGLTKKVSRLEQEVQQKEELTKKVSRLEQELTMKVNILEQERDSQQTFIYMQDFQTHKESRKPWYSPPFYSHPTLGSKMCLRVDANDGHGIGTHVSIKIHLMRGQFDDHLKWPFRADITILLMNQKGDEGHHKAVITFNNKTPDNVADRVKDGRIFQGDKSEIGWGKWDFIPHNKLKPKYLKNDSLQFKILVKVCHKTLCA